MIDSPAATSRSAGPDLYNRPPSPESPVAVAGFVQGELNQARRTAFSYHGLWYLLDANFVGRQWVDWNSKTGILRDPSDRRRRELLLTFNLIFPAVLREAATLALTRPPWAGVPTSDTEQAISSAQIDSKLLQHDWNENDMEQFELDALLEKCIFGETWYENDFDITQGRLLKNDWRSERPQHEFEGRVVTRRWTPFHVLTDTDATSMENLRWIAIEDMKDIGWLRMAYGEQAYDVYPESPGDLEFLRLRLQHLASHNYARTTRTDDSHRFPHHARWKRIWYYPYEQYPLGREIHLAANTVLYDGPWRHDYLLQGDILQHPVIPDWYVKPPGRIRGMGMVEPALESQWEYNKSRSQLTKIKNKCAKPKWLAPKGCNLANAPDDLPNELITYDTDAANPQAKPEPVTPNIPTHVFAEHQAESIAEMDRIWSQQEASRGVNPKGVRSGVAIERLQFGDQLAKGIPMVNHLSALKQIGRARLGLYREYGPDKKLIVIVGENHSHEFYTWKKAASRPDTRVDILHDPGIPLMPSERLGIVERLAAIGTIDPQGQANEIYSYVKFPGLARNFSAENIDELAAKRENDLMMAGNLIPPLQDDEHDVHVRVHTEGLKTHRQVNSNIRAIFRQHIDWHLMQIADMQRQNAELMADMQGAAGSLDELGLGYGSATNEQEPESNAPVQPDQAGRANRETARAKRSAPGTQTPGNNAAPSPRGS